MQRVTAVTVRHRAHGQHEHEHAHTAEPYRKAAPVQKTHRQRLHIGDHARAGRGKAGNSLKEGVHKRRHRAAQTKRQRAEHRKKHPRKTDRYKALAGVILPPPGLYAPQQRREHEDCHHSDGKADSGAVLVPCERDCERRYHKCRFHSQRQAENAADHGNVHIRSPTLGKNLPQLRNVPLARRDHDDGIARL